MYLANYLIIINGNESFIMHFGNKAKTFVVIVVVGVELDPPLTEYKEARFKRRTLHVANL